MSERERLAGATASMRCPTYPHPVAAGDVIDCVRCMGSGAIASGPVEAPYPVPCSRCKGTGQQTVRNA